MIVAPFFSRGDQDFVEPRRELFDAFNGVSTMMIIPHVADDDRGLRQIPRFRFCGDMEAPTERTGFNSLTQLQFDFRR